MSKTAMQSTDGLTHDPPIQPELAAEMEILLKQPKTWPVLARDQGRQAARTDQLINGLRSV